MNNHTTPQISTNAHPNKPPFRLSCAATLAVLGLDRGLGFMPQSTNLTWKAEASVKETYDSNVYLQDNAPPTSPRCRDAGAGQQKLVGDHAHAESRPRLQTVRRLQRRSPTRRRLRFITSRQSEDYITHRGTLNFNGAVDNTVLGIAERRHLH